MCQLVPTGAHIPEVFNVSRGPWRYPLKHGNGNIEHPPFTMMFLSIGISGDPFARTMTIFSRGFSRRCVGRGITWHHVASRGRGMTWRQGQCDLGEEYSFGSRVAGELGLALWDPLGLGFFSATF